MVRGIKTEGDASAEYRFQNIQFYGASSVVNFILLFFNVEILTQKIIMDSVFELN